MQSVRVLAQWSSCWMRYQIRFNPEIGKPSKDGGVDDILHNSAQPERQPLRAVPHLEWQRVELELQLARQ